ncbi:MAG: zinc ABC transporter substrate-binding protein [Burkholderiales bacterium]|nr:zinc ABC transporter substrate-binding protein [Phycisphaerae bacterium]
MRRITLIIGLLLAIGCGKAPSAAPPAEPRIVVCATVYPLADVVRQVGGEYVRVDWILDLGDPMAGFSMSENERHRLTGVDLLVCNGLGAEAWAMQTIASLSETGKVVSLDTMRISRTAPPAGALWLDPLIVREFALLLAERFSARMPARGEYFRARAQALATDLDSATRGASKGRVQVIIPNTMFDPLLDRFGVAGALVDVDPLRLRSIDTDRLRARARKDQIKAIVLPFDTPPGTVAEIEAQTGLRAYLIDQLGLPQYPEHSGYLEILQYNLAQLRELRAL